MSVEELDRLAKQGIDMIIDQELLPVLLMETPSGAIDIAGIVVEPSASQQEAREQMMRTIRELLVTRKARAYAFVTEGWATNFWEAMPRYGSVRAMPPDDRFEIASVIVCEQGKPPRGSFSIIDRQGDGSRRLRGWNQVSEINGAMVVEIP